MPGPKALRRAARGGGNIGESSPGGYPRPKKAAGPMPGLDLDPPTKVSEPDAEGLQATVESIVKQHGIGAVLKALGEIT